jgi:hypothetical protein
MSRPRKTGRTYWPREQDDLVRVYALAGHTADDAAAALGVRTRNAVISRSQKLDVRFRPSRALHTELIRQGIARSRAAAEQDPR